MQLRVAIFVILSVFFHSSSHASSGKAQDSIRIRLSSAPKTLDWNIATTGSESAIIQNIMLGLFSHDGQLEPKLELAKRFSWSNDRKELRIELKDLKWIDGAKLDSHQFLDSFERLLNPKLNSENASLLFDVVGARDYFLGKSKTFAEVGIDAPTPNELVFRLKEPRANFTHILTHWATFPIRKDHPTLTLGPYSLSSFTKEKITLNARSKNAPIKTAVFEVISNGTEALNSYRAKKLDYLLQLEDALLTSPLLNGLPAPGFVDPIRVVALLHLNPSRVMTNSPEKRRLIMKEIPLASLLQAQTRVPAPSIIPSGLAGGPLASNTSFFSPKGNASDKLPDEALTLAYPNDALSKSIAEQIQHASKNLKLKIEALPEGELSTASKKYDLVLTLFGLDYFDPDQLLSSFLFQGTHDLFNLSSAELLKTIQKARSTESIKDRGALYAEAAQYLESGIAIVMPLFYRRRAYLLREDFSFIPGRLGTAELSQIHLKK